MQPKITVIVPCYNTSLYVSATLESIKAQTYKDFECIVINDGSTDNTEEEILKNIKDDNRFSYILQENKGVANVRNLGITLSKGEYILCLDSDDIISPFYLDNAIKFLDENQDYTVYYGKAKMFYENDLSKAFYWNLIDYNYKILLMRNMIYSAIIWRKKDYTPNDDKWYDESMGGYEDWEFLIRLLYGNKKVYRTDDIVFYYRRHKGSRDDIAKKKDVLKYVKYIRMKNIQIYLEHFSKKMDCP